jgi:hypothetical protein
MVIALLLVVGGVKETGRRRAHVLAREGECGGIDLTLPVWDRTDWESNSENGSLCRYAIAA